MKKWIQRLSYANSLGACLLLFCGPATGQQKQVLHHQQQWLEYSAQLKGNGHYSVLLDGGYRWIDNYLTGNMYYIRAGVDRALSDNVSFHAGFAHVGYFFDNHALSQIEHRPYQELNLQNKVASIGLYQRIRVEERFFEPVNSSYNSPFHWFNWRFRYQIMFDVPLFRFSEQRPDHRLSLAIGNEIFINAGKRIKHNQFDQNRFLVSPTMHLGKDLGVAITWTNQYASTFTENRFIHSQVLWLQVRHKFRLNKAR